MSIGLEKGKKDYGNNNDDCLGSSIYCFRLRDGEELE